MAKRRAPEIERGSFQVGAKPARYSSQRRAETRERPIRVSFDGSPSWPAIEIVDTWNGYAVPRVTPAVREQIATWLEHDEARDGPREDPIAADEVREIPTQPDGTIILRGFTFEDDLPRAPIRPAAEIAELRRMATPRAAASRTYYYLRQNDKTIGGPYITIAKLATAAKRRLRAGEAVDAKRLIAGQWADLTEAEAEAVAALL